LQIEKCKLQIGYWQLAASRCQLAVGYFATEPFAIAP
jgi:hypothetical protein